MEHLNEDYKEQIRATYLRPAVTRDVADFTNMRYSNRKWGERLELIANICTALAMASGSIGLLLPDYARVCILVSLMLKACNLTLLTISNVLKKRASLSTDQLNFTLRTIGIGGVANMHTRDLVDSPTNGITSPVIEINSYPPSTELATIDKK